MDKIEVTQADRDAAADYYYSAGGSPNIAIAIRKGYKDDWFRVQAFARHRILATRTDATPVAWMPIESAPKDGTRFLAWCPYVGRVIMRIDGVHRETWAIDPSGRLGCDPTLWQPLPAAPDHIEEPRAMVPATDVAALVDAAKEALDRCGMSNMMRAELEKALAPFTKGRNDE